MGRSDEDLLRECGLDIGDRGIARFEVPGLRAACLQLAAAARADERERCAKECETIAIDCRATGTVAGDYKSDAALDCAYAIRALTGDGK